MEGTRSVKIQPTFLRPILVAASSTVESWEGRVRLLRDLNNSPATVLVPDPGVLQYPEGVLAALLGRLVDGADHGPDTQGHLGVDLVPGPEVSDGGQVRRCQVRGKVSGVR